MTTVPFDNVLLRVRNNQAVIASVAPRFQLAFWPDLAALAHELNISVTSSPPMMDANAQYQETNVPLKNLAQLSQEGACVHVVLPVTARNNSILPDIVLALTQSTRGGAIELVPLPLLLPETELVPPQAEEYLASLLAIYRNPSIPIRKMDPGLGGQP